MDSTESMLEAIDKRIAKLQQIRALIIEEFGQQPNTIPDRKRIMRKRNASVEPKSKGRKGEIHEWLSQNGPSTRAEIIKGTGLPQGTVGGYLSSESDLFENRDGKWNALVRTM